MSTSGHHYGIGQSARRLGPLPDPDFPAHLIRKHTGTTTAAPRRPFIKGPIPLDWMQAAATLPGRALHVGVLLWFRAGLTGSESVTLSTRLSQQFGVTRTTRYRTLRALELAGLIRVERRHGASPVITIVRIPEART